MRASVIKPGWPQWAFVLAIVVLFVPTVLFLAIPNDVGAWLIRTIELAEYESALGFKSARVWLPDSSGLDQPVFSIVEVVKDLPFDNAGIHPGDIPAIGYFGGENGFLWGLYWGARQGSMTLYLTSWEEAVQCHWIGPRKVTVVFPSRTRKAPA